MVEHKGPSKEAQTIDLDKSQVSIPVEGWAEQIVACKTREKVLRVQRELQQLGGERLHIVLTDRFYKLRQMSLKRVPLLKRRSVICSGVVSMGCLLKRVARYQFCIGLLVLASAPPVSSQSLALDIEAPAVLRPVTQATLAVQQPGVVNQVNALLGSPVQEGDLLVELDCRLFEGELASASAERLAIATRLENDRQLLALNSIGRETVQLSEIDLERSLAVEGIARLAVERCRIEAPFDAIVSQVLVRPFDVVDVNQQVVQLVSLDEALVEVILPVSIKPELGATVRLVAMTGQQAWAEISALSPTIDPASQTRVVQALLSPLPDGWLPGQAVTVHFEDGR